MVYTESRIHLRDEHGEPHPELAELDHALTLCTHSDHDELVSLILNDRFGHRRHLGFVNVRELKVALANATRMQRAPQVSPTAPAPEGEIPKQETQP